jgi:HPt (histidine-containing phosphotransfer) domain-containing protein
MLQELVDLFLEGAPQRINLINQSITDAPNLAFHAHALKSMSLNLGARRIVELANQLEELGRSGQVDGAPALFQDLQSAFVQTRTHLLPLRNH